MSLNSLIRKSLRRLGYDLHRSQPQVQDFLSYYGVDVVVDVGANIGQFASSLRDYSYSGAIISIEPISSVFQQLQARAARDVKWTCLQCGLASKAGELTVHVSEESTFSSMLTPLQRATDFDSRARTVREEKVPVRTLDSVMQELCSNAKRPFLKLDVQGFESEVLAGATESLKRFVGIHVELSIQKLYEGQSSIDSMIRFLDEHGFSLALCTPVNFQEDGAPRLMELDGVFINNSL